MRSGVGTANNIFVQCGTSAVVFLNPKNEADGNVYVGLPKNFQGYYDGDSKRYLDLAAWREAHGWDKNSVVAEAEIGFDPDTLALTISSRKPLPRVRAVNHIQADMLGKATGATRVAGPLANPRAKRSWHMDPRLPA